MDEIAKITLSASELAKVTDSEWILTKHRIIEKVYQLFGQQTDVIREEILSGEIFGEEIVYSVPKISKGENYLQLPYVILDHPAVFAKEHIFAVRTMFWWGNFISITLLLKGAYREAFGEKLMNVLQKDLGDFFVCVNDNEWEHHFNADNYVQASAIDTEMLSGKPFIKVALRFDLQNWNELPALLKEGYGKIRALFRSLDV